MKRPGIQLLKIALMLPWVALLGMWLRSYYTLDEWSWARNSGRVSAIVSYQGGIHVIQPTQPNSAPRRLMWDMQRISDGASLMHLYPDGVVTWQAIGIARIQNAPVRVQISPSRATMMGPMPLLPWLTNPPFNAWRIPYWYSLFPTTALPLLLWILPAIRRQRLRKKNCCENCGYDLRASVERCPECGIAIARAH